MNMSRLLIIALGLLLFQCVVSENITISTKQQCTSWYGCHKGFCWAGCSGAFNGIHGPEWCYTKDESTNGYKSCTSNDQCDGCWRCSGLCSI